MECNPFHDGHKYIIDKIKGQYPNSYLVVVLSGNFVQRGEPAVYDKYTRTKQLIGYGIDMVIELPIEFALSSAKYFGRAGVNILDKLGFVDNLFFGSNLSDINLLESISDKINNLQDNELFKEKLKLGLSYPKALSEVLGANLSPNDILGVEYISALKEVNSKINPICITRDDNLKTATELRKSLNNKITTNMFSDYLNYKLYDIYKTKKDFSDYYLINDNLNNKLLNTADKKMSFDERAEILHTKDTTLANTKRVLFNILLDIKEVEVKNLSYGLNINYLRILGIKKEAKSILQHIFTPYLLSYSKKELSKYFTDDKNIDKSIFNNIYASDLYANVANIDYNEATVKLIE